MKFLENISNPSDLKKLSILDLEALVDELKTFVLKNTKVKKGHIESSLTVTELTVALHYVLNTPADRLFWDVGHQAYIHKLLTGRKDQFHSNRQKGGLSGFPHIEESEYDLFTTGHSATSISAIAGLATADKLQGGNKKHVAVIGDGALTGGMAFEALNYLGQHQEDVLVVLNDNEMAIDQNVGGLAQEQRYKSFFRSLDVTYLGTVDGHDMEELIPALKSAVIQKGVNVLVVKTQRFTLPEEVSSPKGYTKAFIDTITKLAHQDKRVVAVTPAMLSGSGLDVFKSEFPLRCFDVGIAEQHAVTFSAGLARGGQIPFCHLYSTFSQRGVDQIIHDVALQNLPVIFMLDRAGLVGNDGATHHGVFDISMLSGVPNLEILAPASAQELSLMMEWAAKQNRPIVIRYPRTGGALPAAHEPQEIVCNQLEEVQKGEGKLAIMNFGFLLGEIEETLKMYNGPINPSIYNIRFAKKILAEDLERIAKYETVWVIEDSQQRGGVGEYIAQQLFELGYKGRFINSALPDEFIEHGSMQELYAQYGLTHQSFLKRLESL